jgi:hypothetical protein
MNRETLRLIMIKDLNMQKACTRMVQRNPSSEQKIGKETCSDLSARLLEELDL